MTDDAEKLGELRGAVKHAMMVLQTFGDTEEGVSIAYCVLRDSLSKLAGTSEIANNVRASRTKSVSIEAIDTDELILLMLAELHANVPEADRPMSMSDLSDEQAERARRAVNAVVVRSLLSKPASRVSSLSEIDGAA